MPALVAQHLRKAFGSQAVLDDANFSLARHERVALIGANGAGKSTLARILAGLDTADAGTRSVRRGLTLRYLAQEPVLDAAASARSVVEDALSAWREATARHAEVSSLLGDPSRGDVAELVAEQAELDDAVMRLGGWERGHEALDFLDKLGVVDVDEPCGPRSGGERRRIALAQLLVASPDVAILDEPTNHLDADTAAWLEAYLSKDFPGAIVLVTHDRYFLDAIAERIVELERGRLTSFPGGYGAYLEKRAELLEHEERVEQNRKNVLRREREWLSRGPKARGTKQKARIERALALEARGPATAGRPGEVSLVAAAAPSQGKTILELRGVELAAAPGQPSLHAPFDFILTSGERVGIVGPNGVGKTTLMRAVLRAVSDVRSSQAPAPGGPQMVHGSIVVGKNTRVAYLDQARAELDDTKSIFDDVRGESGGTMVSLGVRGFETMDLRSYLELFLFDPQKQRQKVGSLSGGERARVALAKVLRQGANLLMFDEPTNDLDLPTLAALEAMLEGYDGSVLVVTHDRAFLDRVATSILAFERDPQVGEDGPATVTRYAGGYEDYVSQRAARGRRPNAGRPTSARSARAAPPSPPSPAPTGPRAAPAPTGALAPPPPAVTGPIAAPPPPPATDPRTAPRGSKSVAKSTLTYAERRELQTIVDAIDKAEARVREGEELLANPELYANRGDEVAGLQARLDAARGEVARLVKRWEWLEAKLDAKKEL